MKILKFKSITMRIWTTFTAVILIIIFGISIIYLFKFKVNDEKHIIQLLQTQHEMLMDNNFKEQRSFENIKPLKDSRNFIVNIDSNNLISKQDSHGEGNPHDGPKQMPPPISGIDQNSLEMWMASFIKDKDIYEKQFNKTYNNNKIIFIISSLSNNENAERSYLISYIPIMQDNTALYMGLEIGGLFIILGFAAAKIIANYISKPLNELEEHMIRIAKKNWSTYIQVKSDDEVGRLAKSMNQMQDELQKIDYEEKMFLQSISHDLKTPVMVIMGHADALIDGVYIDTVEKTAEIIRDESILLDKKIKQLLYLNSLDYALRNNIEEDKIYLDDLLNNIIKKSKITDMNITIEVSLKQVAIHGDINKIQVAIENILENALKYAKKKISLNLYREENFAVVELYNDGPNIDENYIKYNLGNLFKNKTGNLGMGISISKKIVDFYKGKIEAFNTENGVSFILKFPIENKE